MALLQKGEGLGPVCRGKGCIAVFGQEYREKLPHAGFVVNNKYFGCLGHAVYSGLRVVFRKAMDVILTENVPPETTKTRRDIIVPRVFGLWVNSGETASGKLFSADSEIGSVFFILEFLFDGFCLGHDGTGRTGGGVFSR